MAKGCSTGSDLANACETLEGMQRSCVDKPIFHRLPYAAASFSPPVDAAHMRAPVREAVRVELRVILPEYFHSSFEAPLPEPSLKETMQEEVHSVLSEFTFLVCSSRLPEPNTAAFADLQETVSKVVAS